MRMPSGSVRPGVSPAAPGGRPAGVWPRAGMVSVGMCSSHIAVCTQHEIRAWSTEGGRVTQVGEGHETAADADGPVMTFGTPTVGEVLADRYQLEEHVNNDSAGR